MVRHTLLIAADAERFLCFKQKKKFCLVFIYMRHTKYTDTSIWSVDWLGIDFTQQHKKQN